LFDEEASATLEKAMDDAAPLSRQSTPQNGGAAGHSRGNTPEVEALPSVYGDGGSSMDFESGIEASFDKKQGKKIARTAAAAKKKPALVAPKSAKKAAEGGTKRKQQLSSSSGIGLNKAADGGGKKRMTTTTNLLDENRELRIRTTNLGIS
jgi:hypothetical protein